MTGRVLVTDYAWPDLRAETAVLAEAGTEMVVTDAGETSELARPVAYRLWGTSHRRTSYERSSAHSPSRSEARRSAGLRALCLVSRLTQRDGGMVAWTF